MSDQYNISFSTTTAVSSLDKLLERLNKIGTASDKLDGKKINPVTSTAKKGVDDLGNSLDKVFSRQMQQASQLFAEHLRNIEKETTATSSAVQSLTSLLSKNTKTVKDSADASTKEAATSENIRKAIAAETIARQRLNAVKAAAKSGFVKTEPEVFKAEVLALNEVSKKRKQILIAESAEEKAKLEDRKQTQRIFYKALEELKKDAVVAEKAAEKQQSEYSKSIRNDNIRADKEMYASRLAEAKKFSNQLKAQMEERYKHEGKIAANSTKIKALNDETSAVRRLLASNEALKVVERSLSDKTRVASLQQEAKELKDVNSVTRQLYEANRQLSAVKKELSGKEYLKTLEAEYKALKDSNSAQAQAVVLQDKINKRKAELRGTTISTTSSIHSGAQATAAWRAALGAAGASMGIFTSKTILVASAVYATVSAFKASVSAGVEFTDMMARVQAVTGASAETLEWMKEEVRSFAGETIFTAKEAADALLQLGMAGLTATQSIEAMPATLRLATIGVLSTSEAADLATNVMTQFRMEAVHLTAIVDDLATVATNSNTSVKQLGLALTYTGPAAYNAGVSIQETTAAIGALASAGIKGSRAGTAMRRVIQMIVAPSAKAKKVLNEMGVATQDAYGNALPLMSIIDKLAKGNLSYAQAIELVTLKQASGLQSLVANREELGKHIEAQKENANAAKDFQKTLEDTLGADYRLLVSAAYEKMLQFFDANEEGFRSLVQGATEFVKAIDVDKLMQTLSSLKDIAGNLALALAGVWGVSTLSKLSKFTSSLSVAGEVMDNGTKKANLLGVALSTVGRSIPGMVILAGVAGAMAVSFAMAEAKAAATAEELARVRKLAGRDDEKKAKLDDQIAEYEKQLKELKDTRKDLSILENDDKAAEFLRKNAEATKLYEGMLEKAREEREALTKAEKEARLLQLRNKLGESPTSMLMDERASIFSVISKLEGIRDSASAEGKDVSSFQKTIDAYYEKLEILNKKIKETGELTEEQAAERAKLLTEISSLEADLYTDTKDVVARTDEDLNKAFLKRAEAAVAAVKKKNAAEKASEYKRILTEQNKTLEHQELYVRKTIKSELDLHNARVSNFEEYKTNVIGAYDAEIAAETAAMDKLKAKRQEAVNKGELYNDPAYIETAEKIAELEQERAKAVTSLNSQEVELGRTRETTLANYAQGLISTRVLIESVTAAQEKYNKAVEAANDTYKPGSTAHSDALAKAKEELQDDLHDAAGTTGKRFAATLLDNLSGIGQEVADAVASGDYSGLKDALKGALSGAIGSTIGDSITGALGNNLGGLMGDVAADSFSGMAGEAMGGILGAVGGGLAGGLVSGLLAGSKTEITGEGYRIGIETGELFSAEFSKSFKKSSMFSSKRWTEYTDLAMGEFENVNNSLDVASNTLAVQAKKLGVSLAEFSGVLENKDGDISEAIDSYANEIADSSFAAIEQYQYLGESFSEAFGRLADQAQEIADSFKAVGDNVDEVNVDWVGDKSAELEKEYKAAVEVQRQSINDAKLALIEASMLASKDMSRPAEDVRAEALRRYEDDGFWETMESKDLDPHWTYAGVREVLTPLETQLSELVSRTSDTAVEAEEAFNQTLLQTISELGNVSYSEASSKFSEITSAYADSFLTDSERLQIAIDSASSDFSDVISSVEIETPQASLLQGLSLDSTIEEFNKVKEALTDPEMIGKFYLLADAHTKYNEAIEDSLEIMGDIASSALDDLEKAIERQISLDADRVEERKDAISDQMDIINERLAKAEELSNAIEEAFEAVNSTVQSVTLAQRAQAQAELSTALAIANAGGPLPDLSNLEGALSTLQEPSEMLYGSYLDYQRDQLIAANTLHDLNKITEEQLTTDERILAQLRNEEDALDQQHEELIDTLYAQLEGYRSQYNALMGIDDSVLTVAEAVARVEEAILNLELKVNSGGSSSTGTPTGGQGTGTGTGSSGGQGTGTGTGSPDYLLEAFDSGGSLTGDALRDAVSEWGYIYGGVSLQGNSLHVSDAPWYDGAVDLGEYSSLRDAMDALHSAYPSYVPAFADGGVHTGGMRLVGENGPELEVTGPSRIFNNSDTRSMFDVSGLMSELRQTREKNEDLMRQLLKKVSTVEADTRTIKNLKREETS